MKNKEKKGKVYTGFQRVVIVGRGGEICDLV